MKRLPPWIRVRFKTGGRYAAVRAALGAAALNTVCESAQCPNRQECFHGGTATFMILGTICTRQCRFCAVGTGTPWPPDPDEPRRVAALAAKLGLRHVVVTSVSRDDLPDGGAGAFAAVIARLRLDRQSDNSFMGGTALCRPRRAACPPSPGTSPFSQRLPDSNGQFLNFKPQPRAGVTVEVLTPDFRGNPRSIATVLEAGPDVFNHNLETVERLQPAIRPQADYRRSLFVLQTAARSRSRPTVKSGLMVGLGETDAELFGALEDLRAAGCDALTLGQYLAPSRRHLPVDRYVPPAQFEAYRAKALAMGFTAVAAGPLVRSSYHAEALFHEQPEIGT